MCGYDLSDDQNDLITIDFDMLKAQDRAAERDAAEQARQHTIAACRQGVAPSETGPARLARAIADAWSRR